MFGSGRKQSLTDLSGTDVGFLQRTNSIEDKGRTASSLKDRQSSKNVNTSENSDRSSLFRRAETDFSNLYARGNARECGISKFSESLAANIIRRIETDCSNLGVLLCNVDFLILSWSFPFSGFTILKSSLEFLNVMVIGHLLFSDGYHGFD